MPRTVAAVPTGERAFEGAEPLLEDLDHANEALASLAQLASVDEASLARAGGWTARIDFGGTIVLARGDGARWSLLAPPGADPADAMLAARKLHALLGERDPGWDLDR